jgi:ThiF family/Resolvase, N terminal domain
LTTPGKEFHSLDGVDKSEAFRAFVHAPFTQDAEAERNHTSFALQITLTDGEQTSKAMLLGDLAYKGLKKLFDRSDADPEVTLRRDAASPMRAFAGKSVAIWGCGALGGPIAEWLIRAGVRELRLHDSATVTPGVLVRQLSPGLLKAIELVEAGEADHIVVAYFDRLVRSLRVQLEVIERVERAGGRSTRSTTAG